MVNYALHISPSGRIMEEVSAQGYLRVRQIVGQRAVSESEAAENRRVAQEFAAELKKLEEIKRNEPAKFTRKKQARYRKLRNANSRPKRARPAIPSLIPVCESLWWEGVRKGRYPESVKLSSGVTAWRAADVFALLQPRTLQAGEKAATATPA